MHLYHRGSGSPLLNATKCTLGIKRDVPSQVSFDWINALDLSLFFRECTSGGG